MFTHATHTQTYETDDNIALKHDIQLVSVSLGGQRDSMHIYLSNININIYQGQFRRCSRCPDIFELSYTCLDAVCPSKFPTLWNHWTDSDISHIMCMYIYICVYVCLYVCIPVAIDRIRFNIKPESTRAQCVHIH